MKIIGLVLFTLSHKIFWVNYNGTHILFIYVLVYVSRGKVNYLSSVLIVLPEYGKDTWSGYIAPVLQDLGDFSHNGILMRLLLCCYELHGMSNLYFFVVRCIIYLYSKRRVMLNQWRC